MVSLLEGAVIPKIPPGAVTPAPADAYEDPRGTHVATPFRDRVQRRVVTALAAVDRNSPAPPMSSGERFARIPWAAATASALSTGSDFVNEDDDDGALSPSTFSCIANSASAAMASIASSYPRGCNIGWYRQVRHVRDEPATRRQSRAPRSSLASPSLLPCPAGRQPRLLRLNEHRRRSPTLLNG